VNAESPALAIRARSVPACPLCGSAGAGIYSGLRDRLFDAPGEWGFRRCDASECGVLWLDPAPAPEEMRAAYRNYFTHQAVQPEKSSLLKRGLAVAREAYLARRYGYASSSPRIAHPLLALPLYCFPGRRSSCDHGVMYLGARVGARILDVGCGQGALLATLRGLGWEVQGVDFDPAAVQVARLRGLSVALGSLEAQGYPERHFDAVTMSHVIEHVEDPHALLAECRRVLRDGGLLVIATPNCESRGHARFGPAWRGLEPPRHLQVFTSAALARAVERAGLTQVLVRTSSRLASGMFLESRAIVQSTRGTLGFGRGERLRAGLESLMEAACLIVDPRAGEEIVLIATRAR
jgi:2-polyprenyl-3-methyl-5-hydroxy-6-metoxy-1,4-benzoquinol methylase